MSTMTHVDPEEVMAWLDGELPIAEGHVVAAHIEQCAACAAVAAQFRRMSEELVGWDVADVPGRVDKTVMDSIGAAGRRTGGGNWHWGPMATGLGGLAALLLVFLSSSGHRADLISFPPVQRHTADIAQREIPNPLSGTDGGLATTPDERQTKKEPTYAGSVEALADKVPGGGHAAAFGAVASIPAQPMIARTVSLSMRVKELDPARTELEAMLARHHGYMAQLSTTGGQGWARALRGSLRIPTGELSAALKELRALGPVESETQSGEEVTSQHQDLVARLKNAREAEARLQSILQQRTGRISDVLEVEQEIARERGEIERMEAEQAGLEHRVEFASVEISLTEEYKAEFRQPDSAGMRLRNGLVAGYSNARDSVLALVLFVEEYGPAMVVWGIVLGGPAIWIWRRYRRVHRNN